MIKIFFATAFVLLFCQTQAQFFTGMKKRYSKNVKDSFEIYISTPPSYSKEKVYNVVYYCDANLKSGRHLRELLSNNTYNDKLSHTIFVGIGHIGNYHVLRRRDFILPQINGDDTSGQSSNYGQVKQFYSFLRDELIPSINTEFRTNADSNSIVGHSLGGLFAFYCLFQADELFAKYFALSPALWIDHYSIYKFNKLNDGPPQKKYLYFVSGSLETKNRILHGTNQAKIFLDEKKYRNLQYEYMIVKRKTHNSEVPISLAEILTKKL